MKGELEVTYIFETIEKIADKIGLTAKELWHYLVQQKIIESIISICVLITIGIIAIFVKQAYGTPFSAWEDATDAQKPLTVIPLIVCFIVFIVITVKLNVLLNPEYYAFNSLITLIK